MQRSNSAAAFSGSCNATVAKAANRCGWLLTAAAKTIVGVRARERGPRKAPVCRLGWPITTAPGLDAGGVHVGKAAFAGIEQLGVERLEVGVWGRRAACAVR